MKIWPNAQAEIRELPPIPWRRLVLWFAASRLLIFTIAGLSLRIVEPGRFASPRQTPLDWLIRWDAGWYLDVIKNGYAFDPTRMSNVNFLPLYPMLVRSVAWALPSVELAAYLVSNLFCFLAAAVLWRLATTISERIAAADGAVAFFLLGPVSFFFSTIYAEATFAFFALATLLAARRERWVLAGLCGLAAALTRSVGLLLIVPLAVELLQRHPLRLHARSLGFWRSLLCCALPAAGLLLYSAYLGWKFDEPRAYVISQAHGGHGYSYLWDTYVSRHFNGLAPFYKWWFGGTVLVGVGLTLAATLLRQPLSFTALALAFVFLHLSIKTLDCLPRFFSVVVPFYCTLGEIKARWPAVGDTLLVASAALLGLSTTLFVNGYWFT
jgi:Gpi18-like mannosyltransferase